MFADTALALKIEVAEARLTHDAVLAIQGDPSGAQAFVRAVGGGVAAFVRPGSPMNKIIGAGVDSLIDDSALAEVESLYRDHGEPVRVELSTLALADVGRRLTERGYRLLGFENVLGIDLSSQMPRDSESIVVKHIAASQAGEWKKTIVAGFACSDETGIVIDSFTKDVIDQAVSDIMQAPGYDRYLALQDGMVAGGASMRVDAEVALLTGAATLAPYRRRGIQGALLAQRLLDARSRGAKFAVITTAGGTRSQANAIRQGFSLLYARAVLVLG